MKRDLNSKKNLFIDDESCDSFGKRNKTRNVRDCFSPTSFMKKNMVIDSDESNTEEITVEEQHVASVSKKDQPLQSGKQNDNGRSMCTQSVSGEGEMECKTKVKKDNAEKRGGKKVIAIYIIEKLNFKYV